MLLLYCYCYSEMEGQLPKNRRLSLPLKGNRFKKVEETAVTEARKGFVPDNKHEVGYGKFRGVERVPSRRCWR